MIRIIGFVLLLCAVNHLQGQEFNTRLLVHGAQQFEGSQWGVAGWLVAPNITNAPNTWLTIVGPSYKAANWDIEVMGGAVVQGGNSTPLVDVRVGFGSELFGHIGITMWHNSQWIDPLAEDKFYLYHQVSYPCLDGIVVPFVETENLFRLADPDFDNDWSIGIGTAVKLGKLMKMVGAYQWHFFSQPNQVWLRIVINL